MLRQFTTRHAIGALLCGLILSSGLGACSEDPVPRLAEGPDDEPLQDAGADPDPPFNVCHFNPVGCPCTVEGAQGDSCAEYYYVNRGEPDAFTACSYGHYICTSGEWSACIGERVVVVPPDEVPRDVTIGEGPSSNAVVPDAGN